MSDTNTAGREQTSPTITWDDSAKDTILEAFGIEDRGPMGLWDGDRALWSPSGIRVTKENFAGFVKLRGERWAITDNFNDLVEVVKERHDRSLQTDKSQDGFTELTEP